MDNNEVSSSARSIDLNSAAANAKIPSFMISADSHASEPEDLWKKMPSKLRERLPLFKGRLARPEGASNPRVRVQDMEKDGVAAEVMYPDHGLGIFVAEPEVQEAAFHVYNDWLAEYCSYDPKRLFGITTVSAYDIDKAIKEMHRGHDMGLHGVLIWQVPDPKLPFYSSHYEKLWAAAAELGEPINLHILTGFLGKPADAMSPMERARCTVNNRNNDTITALFDIMWSGVFERFPTLKLGLIESEIGWAPFILQQWDYYYERMKRTAPELNPHYKISRLPSEIFREHVCATFMDDWIGTRLLSVWGQENCMWSSDYPHPNMTWPHSKAFVARQIGELNEQAQVRLLSQNVIDLYKLDVAGPK